MPVRQKKALKDGYHVLTVRFLPNEWKHLLAVQALKQKADRRKVSYTEIIVHSVLDRPAR